MLTSITASRFEGRVAAGNQAGCKESQSLASYFSLYSKPFPQSSETDESVAFWPAILTGIASDGELSSLSRAALD
jgi:hypothetical protein